MKKERLFLISVIALNLIIKAVPAGIIELGNDEVYYLTYALFPDWSHFDHPPLVGLTIQLFTLNLSLDNELFIRLGSLILSTFNIIILFSLVKRIYSQQAAIIAALLFTSSFYFNIISGLFILPDTPQIFFVLLSLYFGIPAVTDDNFSKKANYHFILFGLFAGLAFLSKYHSLFLWFGFGMYILLHKRRWLKNPALYLSILTTLILMIPVIYWNINNNFISFTYQGNRLGLFQGAVNINSFLRFNFGQIFYQNPILFIIFILALKSLYRKKRAEVSQVNILLVYISLPLIIIFTLSSLFKNTFPHWTGPAFIGLIILSSEWLAEIYLKSRGKVLYTLAAANLLVVMVVIAGSIQINYGIFKMTGPGSDPTRIGKNDFTLDMYGWKQAKVKFGLFLSEAGIANDDHQKVKIISTKWFPAAHLDFYIAHPLNIDLIALGKIEYIHKYYWINQTRTIGLRDKVYFITTSQQYSDPVLLKKYFRQIVPRDTLHIERNGITVKNLFIYEMLGLNIDSIQSLKP